MNMPYTPSWAGARPAHILIVIALLIAVLGVLPITHANDSMMCDSTTDYLAAGQEKALAADYEGATWDFECALEADPTNAQAHFWRGGLAGAAGDANQLGSDLFAFFQQRSGNQDPVILAVVKTIPSLSDSLTARQDDIALHLLRGMAYTIAGIPLSANADFDAMIALAPDNAVGYLFRWFIDANESPRPDFEDTNLKKGMELAPDSILADWVYSFPATDLTKPIAENQLAHFNDIIQAYPDHPFAYETRGMANAMLGDPTAATSDFYQHLQNINSEPIEESELAFETLLEIDATAGNVYRIPFTAHAGQKVNIVTARSSGGIFYVFPVTPVVLDPAGEVMNVPYKVHVEMGSTRTPIIGLEIPADGTYSLLVTPNYSGQIEIALTEGKVSGM
jgi:tetratricopeptide (TPR) repeat protein